MERTRRGRLLTAGMALALLFASARAGAADVNHRASYHRVAFT